MKTRIALYFGAMLTVLVVGFLHIAGCAEGESCSGLTSVEATEVAMFLALVMILGYALVDLYRRL